MTLRRADLAPEPRTLVDIIRSTAMAYGTEPAVGGGDTALSYDDLLAEAELLADRLRELGVGPGDKVGIRLSSGTNDLYVAILATLFAGAAYVPVDADDPQERADLVFGEARVAVVVTDGPAWVIFTSGSTGVPKGVAVTHRSAAAFVDAEARLFLRDEPIGPDDRVSPACRWRSTRRARRCGWPGGTAPAWCRRRAHWCGPEWTSAPGWSRRASRCSARTTSTAGAARNGWSRTSSRTSGSATA